MYALLLLMQCIECNNEGVNVFFHKVIHSFFV